jgi:excisionase family DNA binding protein
MTKQLVRSHPHDRRMTNSNDQPMKLLHDIQSVMDATGLGRTTIYELFRSGDLPSVKVGRRRLVTDDALNAFVSSLGSVEAGDELARLRRLAETVDSILYDANRDHYGRTPMGMWWIDRLEDARGGRKSYAVCAKCRTLIVEQEHP